jgi:hypothetical protein
MINVICAVRSPLPIQFTSQCTRRSFDPTVRWITGIILFLFQFRIQILTHSRVKLSCYRVLIWTHHSWCRGESLPQLGSLRCGRHHRLQLDTGHHRLQVDTGHHRLQLAIRARVPALLPHLSIRDTSRRHHGHL